MRASLSEKRPGPSRLTFLLLLILSLACCAGTARAQQPPQDDVQNWNELLFRVPIKDWVDLTATMQLRVGRDLTDFADERGGFGFNFKLSRLGPLGKALRLKQLSFAPSLLHIASQPTPDRKTFENRLVLAGTAEFVRFSGITLTNRNQFERRYREPANSTRYRNRLQAEYERKDSQRKDEQKRLHLFISDEVFYDFTAEAWVRNRFSVGAGRTFSPMFRLDLYYLRQNDGRSRPGDIHIVGSTLRVSFGRHEKEGQQ